MQILRGADQAGAPLFRFNDWLEPEPQADTGAAIVVRVAAVIGVRPIITVGPIIRAVVGTVSIRIVPIVPAARITISIAHIENACIGISDWMAGVAGIERAGLALEAPKIATPAVRARKSVLLMMNLHFTTYSSNESH